MNINLERGLKKIMKRKISFTLVVLAAFSIKGTFGFAAEVREKPMSLKTSYIGSSFENKKVWKSIEDIISENFPGILGWTIAPAARTAARAVLKDTIERVPLLKNFLNTKDAMKIGFIPTTQSSGESIAKAINETNKAFNEAEKRWAKVANSEMVGRTKIDEQGKKIAEQEKMIEVNKDNLAKETKNRLESEKKQEVVNKDLKDQIVRADRKATESINEVQTKIRDVEQKVQSNRRAIEHLDKKISSGIATIAAMSIVDMVHGEEGDVNIGAAVGGFEGTQAVAVGVSYAASRNLSISAKLGVDPNRTKYATYGAGFNYRFNIHNR